MKQGYQIKSGSLDMLLDTLCNTFGGVCFIALMIAILSAMLPKDIDEKTDSSVTEQMLVDQERERLVRHRDELRAAITAFSSLDSKEKDFSATGLAEILASNKTVIAQMDAERARLEKVLAAREYSKREKERLERLNAKLENEIKKFAGTVRKVRIPIERELPDLKNVSLWLHAGMLYIIDDNSHVKWSDERFRDGKKSMVCSLVEGAGYVMDEHFTQDGIWRNICSRIDGRCYARIYSDTKSFPQLCRLRDSLASSRKMYNWHLVEEKEIVFVARYDGKVQ